MILGFSCLGVSSLTNTAKPQLAVKSYDTVRIYGAGKFEKLYGTHQEMSSSTIQGETTQNVTIMMDSYTIVSFDPVWDANTYLLAKFNDALSSGTVEYIDSAITKWLIYRKDNNNTLLTYITTVPNDVTSYYDYSVTKGNAYIYYLFAANDTEIAAPIVSSSVACDYWGWFLVDVDNLVSFAFDSNFEGGDLTGEEQYTEYQNNLAYSIFTRGQHNAFAGTIQAIIWDHNTNITFEQGNAILAQLREFILSGRTAYLKDRRGRMWKVFLYGYRETPVNNAIPEQIIGCSFSFKQIDDEYNGGAT
jgi:hypothetical protein